MIGHRGHPETIGTMGHLPEGEVLLVEDRGRTKFRSKGYPKPCLCHTNNAIYRRYFSVVKALQKVSRNRSPHKEDICYATTNRQLAVKEIAKKIMTHF